VGDVGSISWTGKRARDKDLKHERGGDRGGRGRSGGEKKGRRVMRKSGKKMGGGMLTSGFSVVM